MLRTGCRRMLIVLALVAMSSPGFGAASDTSGVASIRAAMERYAHALLKGTPAEIAASYAADGELLLPGLAPLRGPEAIRSFLAPLVKQATVTAVSVDSEFVDIHGAAADQWGTYSQTVILTGKPVQTVHGRYAAIWHQVGPNWRLFRLMMQPL